MCGIAGVNAEGPASEAIEAALRAMVKALRHRGPDDEGWQSVAEGGAATLLGSTRLAIQDLSRAGCQPMRDPVTGHWVVLNGEIYNHWDLRESLGERGEPWRSRSDTETVLRAYGAWGIGCLSRLKGMFALAIWDSAEQALFCARDRLGIKPFYYTAADGRFLFGSEVRALLASGLVARRVSTEALAGYVRFGSVPEPLTLVEGLRSLPPGHWMRVRAGRIEKIGRYWGLDLRPETGDPQQAVREVRDHLERAVREHLLSDVPVASFLSGGLDSSIVTALAARASSGPVRAFTVGFLETDLDESPHAAALAARHGVDHRVIRLSEEQVARLVPEAVGAMDLPTIDGINTFVVARAVAQTGSKVALSGLGGDELFGGYRSFRILPWAERWASLLGLAPDSLRSLAAGGGDFGARAAELTARGLSLKERYESLRALWSRGRLRQMELDPPAGCGSDDPDPDLPARARVGALELSGYMRSMLLRDADAMGMAHSLEIRVPFLDHELVERCLRLAAVTFRKGGPKPLLQLAAGDLLPPEIARRPKQGFALPMEAWMRGPLKGFARSGLDRLGRSQLLPGIDLEALEQRFASRRLQWSRLWQMSVLGHWVAAHLQ